MKKEKSVKGPPTKYRPEMCETVIELMLQGASLEEVAAELDITVETLSQWRNPDGEYYKHDLSEAVKIGIQKSKAWWLKSGRINLENKDFSPALWYMNMKNRFGWSDKVQSENTHNHVLIAADEDEL